MFYFCTNKGLTIGILWFKRWLSAIKELNVLKCRTFENILGVHCILQVRAFPHIKSADSLSEWMFSRHISLATSGWTVSPMPNLMDSRAVNLCTAPWPLKHNTPREPFKYYVAEFFCQKMFPNRGCLFSSPTSTAFDGIFVETKVVDLGGTIPSPFAKTFCNIVFDGLPYMWRVNNVSFHEKL